MVVKIISKPKYISKYLPKYALPGDSGMDLRADIENPLVLNPLERALVKTGIYVQLPERTEIQIRPRSGQALKYGLSIVNSPATIDSNYRGELGVILVNLSNEPIEIIPNSRIAQMVCAKVEHMELEEVDTISDSPRMDNGYGNSGIL